MAALISSLILSNSTLPATWLLKLYQYWDIRFHLIMQFTLFSVFTSLKSSVTTRKEPTTIAKKSIHLLSHKMLNKYILYSKITKLFSMIFIDATPDKYTYYIAEYTFLERNWKIGVFSAFLFSDLWWDHLKDIKIFPFLFSPFVDDILYITEAMSFFISIQTWAEEVACGKWMFLNVRKKICFLSLNLYSNPLESMILNSIFILTFDNNIFINH